MWFSSSFHGVMKLKSGVGFGWLTCLSYVDGDVFSLLVVVDDRSSFVCSLLCIQASVTVSLEVDVAGGAPTHSCASEIAWNAGHRSRMFGPVRSVIWGGSIWILKVWIASSIWISPDWDIVCSPACRAPVMRPTLSLSRLQP
jgi:hypothetical protein